MRDPVPDGPIPPAAAYEREDTAWGGVPGINKNAPGGRGVLFALREA